MTFFYDMNKKLAELDKAKEQLTEGAKPAVAEGQLDELSPELLARTRDAASKKASAYGNRAEYVKSLPHQQSLAPERQGQIDLYTQAQNHYVGLANKAAGHKNKMADTLTARQLKADLPARMKNMNKSAGSVAEDNMDEGSTGDYSARKARAGKDIGKPGKAFAKIAKGAAERYGSKERGEKVAGAVLAKLRKAHPQEGVAEGDMEEGNEFTQARLAAIKANKPTFTVGSKAYKVTGDTSQEKAMDEAAKVKPFSSDDYDEFGVRHSSSFNRPPRGKSGDFGKDSPANPAFARVKQKAQTPVKSPIKQKPGMEEAAKVGGRDMTPDLTRAVEKASGGKQTLRRDAKGVLQVVKKKTEKKVDEIRLADLPKRTVQGKHYGGDLQKDHPEHDDDEMSDQPKKTGRKTVGAGKGKKIGAKVKGTSKLHKKPAIREDDVEIQDRGEYDMEGSAVKDDIHSIIRDVKALHNVLADDENLPEWVQSKMAKAEGMISSVRDYMLTRHEREGEQGTEMELDEKAVSVAQRRAAGIAHAAQKGEIPKSKLRGASKEMAKMDKKELHKFAATKERGLPAKKEEVEETTVSGSVATAPAPKAESAEAPKKSKGGMQFGKGIYDSMNRDLEAMIAESMSINISSSTEGGDSVTVTATDEDAGQLKELLKRAGIGDESHSEHACPSCGQEPCACAEMVDENQPEWPTNTETSPDALQYAGGLNKPKTDVAGAGQTVMPTTAVRVQEGEGEELDESKCMECGMYEDKCECDKPMDESLERIRELAGVNESAQLNEFLPVVGAALGRAAVAPLAARAAQTAAGPIARTAVQSLGSAAGQAAGTALQNKLTGSDNPTVKPGTLPELGKQAGQAIGTALQNKLPGTNESDDIDMPEDSQEIRRVQELAGVQEAAKPDFLDINKNGDTKEPWKQAAQDDEKVEESILSMRRLWQEYKG